MVVAFSSCYTRPCCSWQSRSSWHNSRHKILVKLVRCNVHSNNLATRYTFWQGQECFRVYIDPISPHIIMNVPFQTLGKEGVTIAYTQNLGFVSPCIIIHSNKSNKPDASISQIYCSSFKYIQLNMFRTSSCPSSGAYKLQHPPSVYCWNVVVAVSVVVVGPTGPTTTIDTATTTFQQ
jgi:hypothetical protein